MKIPPQRERWACLLDLVQNMWRTGEIPQELGWTILVLIPKGTTDTRGIGLLDTLWKVVEALIDTRLCTILHMHNVLHRFRDGRGTETDIMELKLPQELSRIDQDPLFLLFLDLRKAYDTVDRYRLLVTLEGYGVGPRMCGILETLWECHNVLLRQNGFHGTALPVTRGKTQGGLVSLILFNVAVDKLIRTWLYMTVEYQRVYHGRLIDTIGRRLGVFYTDDIMVGSRYSDWLQHAMNILVGLFRRYFLVANIAKSRTITCQPRSLQAGMSEGAMALK